MAALSPAEANSPIEPVSSFACSTAERTRTELDAVVGTERQHRTPHSSLGVPRIDGSASVSSLTSTNRIRRARDGTIGRGRNVPRREGCRLPWPALSWSHA